MVKVLWHVCSACVAADAHCLCAGEVHLAALHLLCTGDVHGAMQTYARAHLLGEAVALGSARLLPQDPFLQVSTAAWSWLISGNLHPDHDCCEVSLRRWLLDCVGPP